MDEGAVDLLRRSVAEFNRWRRSRPGSLDLRRADLAGLPLAGADLREAQLFAATLRGARLAGADLRDVHLDDADLEEADLSRARARRAHLVGARLGRADLSGADLREANLERADLRGANLRRADLRGALISGALLSGAGLDGADMRGVRSVPADGVEAVEALVKRLEARGNVWITVRFLLLTGALLLLVSLGPDWGSLLRQGRLKPNPFLASRMNVYTAQSLLLKDRPAEAEAQLRQALARDPRLKEAWAWLAFACDAQGKTAESEKAFARFLALRPTRQELDKVKETLDHYGSPADAKAIRRLLREKGYE